MSHRPLLIAEAANPEWVSVPLEGWSHARAIMQLTGGHLVTQVRNREAFLRAGLREGDDFTAIDSEALAAPAYKLAGLLRGGNGKGWTMVTALSGLTYPYFEWLIWRQFKKRLQAGEFDLVHRITPLSPTMSSPLAGRCRRIGVPFVMGPLNGGVPWPKAFDAARRQEREWLSYIRGMHTLLPGYASTRRNATAIVIGSQDTWRQMPDRYRHKCVYIPENAIDPQRFAMRKPAPPPGDAGKRPVKAVFVGRLVPYKGPDMLIQAAAPLVRQGLLQLEIIGDGPMMNDLKSMVASEQLADGVTLAGWVEHTRLQERLIEHDLFTFPSIREFGGAVVLEAMAVGLVPVVVGYGGPAELVTESTGVAIPIGTREEIIARLRQALADLCEQPQRIAAMSAEAVRRAHTHFTWEAKAWQMLQVYDWATGQRPDKPDFGMPLG